MITQAQTNLVKTGFGHMVDNGYSKIETVNQVILAMEVHLERARREKRISVSCYEANPGADTVISLLEPMIRNITGRAGR